MSSVANSPTLDLPNVSSTNHSIAPLPLEQARVFTPEFISGRSKWKRPDGSVTINARASSAKLAALGFDPIETMVKKFDEIQSLIDQMMLSNKPSMLAMTQLLGLQQKISNDLIKFGYLPCSADGSGGDDESPTIIELSD